MENLNNTKKEYVPPTGSLETYLPLYRELYKKYFEEFRDKQSQTEGAKELAAYRSVSPNTKVGFEYFLLEDGFRKIKQTLDFPIIMCAKYQKGDKIIFIKERFTPKDAEWPNEDHGNTQKNVECIGEISGIKTSENGSGELLYYIINIFPECWESNPYALEKNIIKLRNEI